MITIDRKTVSHIVTQFRHSLGLPPGSYLPVRFSESRRGFRLRCMTEDVSLTCELPGGEVTAEGNVPLRALTDYLESAAPWLEIAPRGEITWLRWRRAGESHSERHERQTVTAEPPVAPVLVGNPRRLADTLFQASRLTDPDSRRYALGCLRLRGDDGQLAATDGRQAYTASGFSFPEGEVLIAADPLVRFRPLEHCTSISVGRTDEWLCISLAAGTRRWLVELPIRREGRFPQVENCWPAPGSGCSTLELAPGDAQYLLRHLPRWLGRTSAHITFELGADQAGRPQASLWLVPRPGSQAAEAGSSIELVLDQSSYRGPGVQQTIENCHLQNLLQLGFRTLSFTAPGSPAFVVKPQQRYVMTAFPACSHSPSATRRLHTSSPADDLAVA